MEQTTADAIFAGGAAALVQALQARQLSAVAATRHYLQRIAAANPRLNAYNQLDTDAALAAAAAADARLAAGRGRALEGLPLAVKANIACAGLPAHAGIAALAGAPAAEDAEVVARLRAAGAVILGITNMHEAAFGATTANPHFGPSHNPWRHGFTPGGSSGGSGVAVAAGLCAAALGTDTFGSVRIPASWCGIAALKPSNGLVPDAGVVPLVGEYDCVGPMAVRVADCELLLRAMATPAPGPDLGRVAVAEFAAGPELHPAVASALRTAAGLLRGLGLEVEAHRLQVDFPALRRAIFLSGAESVARVHAAALARDPQGFSEELRARAALGADASPSDREAARQQRLQAGRELHAVLAVADVVLMPATPQPAFAFAERPPQSLADFTMLASVARLPALALPAGWTSDGLPVGVQLVGRAGSDLALLGLGARLEAALNAHRWPPAAD